jgi:hypothetical protein
MAWSVYGGTFGGLGSSFQKGGSGSGPVSPIGPATETTAALDLMLERSQKGVPGAQRDYWKLVLDRPNWCFLCNPEGMKTELEKPESERKPIAPQPLLWTLNEKVMIGAFTSEAAAMETHRQMQNATPEMKDSDLPPAAILTMPVVEAIRWLQTLPRDRVTDVVINRRANVNVAHIGLSTLPSLYEWAVDRMPDQLWDHFIKSVQETNQPGSWARLRRRFAQLNPWWLPADPGGANTPLVAIDGDKGYLVLGTHAEGASRAFQRVVGEAAKDMKPRIGPVSRDKLLLLIDTISAEPKGPKHAIINPGGNPAIIELAELAKVLREPVPA